MRFAPRLIVFTDTTRASPESMLARFTALAHGARVGAVLFTVRDYGLPLRERWELGARLHELARLSGQSFGFADRADLTRAFGADALHLPENGLSADDARRYLAPDVFLSRACHDPLLAAEPGANAVLLSPIFEARKGRRALGLCALQQARSVQAAAVAPTLYALGGVDAGNAAACLAAGAVGIAVIGAALAVDPTPLLEALEISRC